MVVFSIKLVSLILPLSPKSSKSVSRFVCGVAHLSSGRFNKKRKTRSVALILVILVVAVVFPDQRGQ